MGLVSRRPRRRSAGRARSRAAGRGQAQAAGAGDAEYFSVNAASWDHIRSLHAPDRAVEAAMLKLVGKRPFQSMLDLGTGTGRLLEIFCAALPARRRHRHVARDADRGARQSRQGRHRQCAGAAGRHLCAAGRARRLRSRHHPPGAALSRRSGAAPSARRRGCCGRPAGWSSSISRRMRWNSCATSMRICGSAFPTGRSPNGLPRPASISRTAQEFEPRGGNEARLTVKLWLGRDRAPADRRSRQ